MSDSKLASSAAEASSSIDGDTFLSDSTREFVAGTVGGFIGKVVEYPMDTIKVLMQTQDVKKPTYSSSWDCAKQIYKDRGTFGFYRGLAVPLVGSMAEISTLMTTYGFFKRLLGESNEAPELPAWKLAIASGGSGIGVSCVLSPVELIKCKLQVQHQPNYKGTIYKGPLDCIYQICKTESPMGLTRGLGSTLVREIPGNVAWFGAYEAVCWSFRKEKGEKLNPGVYMFAGACAGVSYWTIPFPADTVKSRIQTAPAGENLKFWPVMKDIVRQEGIKGLYRGWLVTVLRAAPANAAVFYSYEMAMAAMGQVTHGHPALDSDSSLDIEQVYYKQMKEIATLQARIGRLEQEAETREADIHLLQEHLGVCHQRFETLKERLPASAVALPRPPRVSSSSNDLAYDQPYGLGPPGGHTVDTFEAMP